MPRFYVLPENIRKDNIIITGREVHHILDVLQKKVGDELTLFDGKGNEYKSEISGIEKTGRERVITAKIVKTEKTLSEPGVKLTIYQSIPKGRKMDYIIQKCTELGVVRLVPVLSERTVVKLEGWKKESKIRRWREISKNAAQQSGRGLVPEVGGITDFSEAIRNCRRDDSCKLILWESERSRHLKAFLGENCKNKKSIAVFIGPEGGFSHEEVAEAEAGGFNSVTLGPRVLRTETAGLITAALIFYEKDELG